jgi:hypothetical protein
LQLALCTSAFADIRVVYVDSAPDTITITNRSGCDLGPFELTIDLGQSPAGLIFDTSGQGAGYAGFAPLRVVGGAEQVLEVGLVTDGDNRLILKMDFLGSLGSVLIEVDVDDTDEASALGRTIIAGSEIAGAAAEVRLIAGGPPHSGKFGTDGVAIVPLEACIS